MGKPIAIQLTQTTLHTDHRGEWEPTFLCLWKFQACTDQGFGWWQYLLHGASRLGWCLYPFFSKIMTSLVIPLTRSTTWLLNVTCPEPVSRHVLVVNCPFHTGMVFYINAYKNLDFCLKDFNLFQRRLHISVCMLVYVNLLISHRFPLCIREEGWSKGKRDAIFHDMLVFTNS